MNTMNIDIYSLDYPHDPRHVQPSSAMARVVLSDMFQASGRDAKMVQIGSTPRCQFGKAIIRLNCACGAWPLKILPLKDVCMPRHK